MKIIKIDGIRGLITAFFIGLCLFAGFVMFPGFLAMSLWNKFLTNDIMMPHLTLFQGVLLWGIIFVSYIILSKEAPAVSFQDARSMSDAELKTIVQKAKMESHLKNINSLLNGGDIFEKLGKTPTTLDKLKNNCTDKDDKDNQSDNDDKYTKAG